MMCFRFWTASCDTNLQLYRIKLWQNGTSSLSWHLSCRAIFSPVTFATPLATSKRRLISHSSLKVRWIPSGFCFVMILMSLSEFFFLPSMDLTVGGSVSPLPAKNNLRAMAITNFSASPHTVEPRSYGPSFNGIPPIIDTNFLFLHLIFFIFLYWLIWL